MSTTGRNGNRPVDFDELTPPRDLDAEKAVLGSILLAPDCLDDISLILVADDFTPANALIFTAMMSLHHEGKRVDSKLLANRLKKVNALDDVGGIGFLIELSQAAPIASNAVYYANIVRDKATLRSLLDCGLQMVQNAMHPASEPRETLERFERQLFAILDDRGAEKTKSLGEAFRAALASIEDRKERGAGGGQPTGFADLDNLLGGLHSGELTILAARTSMGKTAFAVQLATHVASRRVGTLFASLEMSAAELAERMVICQAGVDSHHVRNGLLNADERRRLVQASAELAHATMTIADQPTMGLMEIAAHARRQARKTDLGLVVIDYLQLLEPEDRREIREQQVAGMTRRLKALARELKIPVLCLAQLNRQADAGTNVRPRLSHLRESGAIEQDADVVLFLHRQEYFETDQAKIDAVHGQAEVIVAKHRNGPTGIVPMTWRGDCMRFENAARTRQRDVYEQP